MAMRELSNRRKAGQDRHPEKTEPEPPATLWDQQQAPEAGS
ncbi:hypothetical protein ASAP_1720 [Asaia bogorensis]|uniref:Uncharacterized protein n=1 Tax=Asaia bogorensis TaxID=91915 RepID=A0A060QFS3_9PROT|nr:hypothetical protein ASAP_1720 [Asaia bogorensis]